MIAWYNVYNKQTFLDTYLFSRKLTLTLGDLGEKTILLTLGNEFGVTIDGRMLIPGLNEKNPFQNGDWLCYVDADDEVWLGYVTEDEE